MPLDHRAVAALSHTALGLDIYTWLAQRLHRVNPARPSFVAWANLWDQFGMNYKRINKFREVFLHALAQVQTQYPRAEIAVDGRGLTLSCSPPANFYKNDLCLSKSCNLNNLVAGTLGHPSPEPAPSTLCTTTLIHGHFGARCAGTLGHFPVLCAGHFGAQTYSSLPDKNPVVVHY